MADRILAAVFGASGFSGAELLRLLASHPGVEVTAVMAGERAGQRVGDVHPHLTPYADMTLEPADAARVRRLAVDAFEACRCEAMARVDFFLEEIGPGGSPGRGFLVNEVNTIPGFTPISMYPRLWECSGLEYGALLDRLVELAVARHERRARRAGRQR